MTQTNGQTTVQLKENEKTTVSHCLAMLQRTRVSNWIIFFADGVKEENGENVSG